MLLGGSGDSAQSSEAMQRGRGKIRALSDLLSRVDRGPRQAASDDAPDSGLKPLGARSWHGQQLFTALRCKDGDIAIASGALGCSAWSLALELAASNAMPLKWPHYARRRQNCVPDGVLLKPVRWRQGAGVDTGSEPGVQSWSRLASPGVLSIVQHAPPGTTAAGCAWTDRG